MHMSRQVLDSVIIAAVLVLGASHLYAQGFAGRKVIHLNQAGRVAGRAVSAATGPNGGATAGAHPGAWSRSADGGVIHTGTCTTAAGVVPCTMYKEFTSEVHRGHRGPSVTLCKPLW